MTDAYAVCIGMAADYRPAIALGRKYQFSKKSCSQIRGGILYVPQGKQTRDQETDMWWHTSIASPQLWLRGEAVAFAAGRRCDLASSSGKRDNERDRRRC